MSLKRNDGPLEVEVSHRDEDEEVSHVDEAPEARAIRSTYMAGLKRLVPNRTLVAQLKLIVQLALPESHSVCNLRENRWNC